MKTPEDPTIDIFCDECGEKVGIVFPDSHGQFHYWAEKMAVGMVPDRVSAEGHVMRNHECPKAT